MSFINILEKYRKISFSEHDKGNRFERLMQAYLQTDPQFTPKLKKVWLWNEFPGKEDFGGKDTGIDLIAKTFDREYWAIQCKCYQEDAIIDKPAVDSFLSTSSREFHNEENKIVGFSHRLWISTTNKWGPNATEAIKNQNPPVSRINYYELLEAPVDWEKLDEGIHGEASRTPKKSLFPHQTEALEKTEEYFKNADRGKLIMACGTGKTFTSLRIAENETDGKGLILFLVPSIALLGQTLREWSSDAKEPINAICICSDPQVSRKKTKNNDTDTFSVVDLALPASTDAENILNQFRKIKANVLPGMTVVFSTYQSIEVVARAQKVWMENGFNEFDLIICDEAHRTTGVTLADEDESAFVKVHDNDFIKAKKRIYMTATPRLYSDDSKSKAAQAEAILCSMDDSKMYGEEIYRIGFGEAVEHDLLTDYKVLILTLNDQDVPPAVQRMIADENSEINADDASKLIGCINALSKQFLGDGGETKRTDPEPMKRAVAFCQNIATSKKITSIFNTTTDEYLSSLPAKKKEEMVSIASRHIDGTMSAPVRDEMMGWLKEPTENNECRILTNVRVLSEGVDVPSLDAVLFLSAKNSQIDVVQSVGRVMRKSPGKKYGYIIIPIVVPADVEPDVALDDSERYKVVWTVLNALRAHDDRFNATINKIELNKNRPGQILVGRPQYTYDEDGKPTSVSEGSTPYEANREVERQLMMQFEQLQSVVYARMVEKVGDRRYWEQWAKDVAVVAERQTEIIQNLINRKGKQKEAFANFLAGLQKNINPSIDETQAVDMLSQHIITEPIFEALFKDYSFVKNNPVSMAMQNMLDTLGNTSLADDSQHLQKFYDSVRKRAEDIDNVEGKQRIIIELYEKFFRTAFPKMVERLGIVYTPVEVVDFILHSVNDVLKQEFGRSISDKNIHILDPFTGTGTFMTRLLQSGLIEGKDLLRKYKQELHANEIVLLAYYIAAVNIENAYHDLRGESSGYEPFEGIVLTDTFQLGETDVSERLSFKEMFPQNSERVARQKQAPLRVILGNPPYSIGQKSANDDAQNQKYEKLDTRIAETYAKESTAVLSKSMYDAYIKAFRWSSDRLDPENGGVIAFVSNGAWVDSNSADGFRKVIEQEFSSIWVFNLRGNQRTSGELSRREGGKIFGSGSRAPIAITLLVKNPSAKDGKATIHYHDIGDYLSREEKLLKISKFQSISNSKMEWKAIHPNEHGDWINKRSELFKTMISLAPQNKYFLSSDSFFSTYSNGFVSSRDAWVINFSKKVLQKNIITTINHYNEQRKLISSGKIIEPERISSKGSWSRDWLHFVENNKEIFEEETFYRKAFYRPYNKTHFYFADELNQERYQLSNFFPSINQENLVICITGKGSNKLFSLVITDNIPCFDSLNKSQCFPIYFYDEKNNQSPTLFDYGKENDSGFIRRDGITDFIFTQANKRYGKNVSKEDIFYYVYGILHSPDYRKTFANDLKKMLPRLPLVEDVRDFWKFSNSGRKLADLHLKYEDVPPYPDVKVEGAESGFFRVEKMRFPSKGEKDTILYNSQITVSNIPAKAFEYVVNGKSAIEWIMERYQVKVDKESGIKNDPNDWAEEVGNPRYILDLLLSIVNVSVQTVELVNELPKLMFE